jgi:hypothetical protein
MMAAWIRPSDTAPSAAIMRSGGDVGGAGAVLSRGDPPVGIVRLVGLCGDRHEPFSNHPNGNLVWFAIRRTPPRVGSDVVTMSSAAPGRMRTWHAWHGISQPSAHIARGDCAWGLPPRSSTEALWAFGVTREDCSPVWQRRRVPAFLAPRRMRMRVEDGPPCVIAVARGWSTGHSAFSPDCPAFDLTQLIVSCRKSHSGQRRCRHELRPTDSLQIGAVLLPLTGCSPRLALPCPDAPGPACSTLTALRDPRCPGRSDIAAVGARSSALARGSRGCIACRGWDHSQRKAHACAPAKVPQWSGSIIERRGAIVQQRQCMSPLHVDPAVAARG